MMWRSSLVAVAFVGVTHNALAFCIKPDAPSCANGYGNFHDQFDFRNCQREMEWYKTKVGDFTSCLKREGNDAISEYNDAVASFNSRTGD